MLGAYVDRHGRRKGLILSLTLMAIGTACVAFVPGYASIGIAVPVIVLLGRLLQSFSAGVELGGVWVYLAEIATPGRRGFSCSWQSGSQQVAVIFAASLGVLLNQLLMLAQAEAADYTAFEGEAVDLQAVITRAVEKLALVASRRDIELWPCRSITGSS